MSQLASPDILATFGAASSVALCGAVVALLFVGAALWFGWRVLNELHLKALHVHIKDNESPAAREALKEYLSARGDIWSRFITLTLTIAISLVLFVLLIFHVISSEAGLALLAAMVSYAFGAGTAKAGPSSGGPLGRSDRSSEGHKDL